jgi:hypothetical protein
MQLPVTPSLQAPRRFVKLVPDAAEGTEIYSTSDVDEEGATIKTPRYTGGPPSRPRMTPNEATLVSPPHAEPDATIVAAPRHRGMPEDEDTINNEETVLRDTRPPVSSAPAVVPTRVQPVMPSPPPTPMPSVVVASGHRMPPPPFGSAPAQHAAPPAMGPGPGQHVSPSQSGYQRSVSGQLAAQSAPRSGSVDEAAARRRQRLWMFAGLAGIALLSFMVALAASNRGSGAQAPQEAAQPLAVQADATGPAEDPRDIDAAAAAIEPTVPSTGSANSATRTPMALLVVRTIPDGGTVKVGDQVREAARQPGAANHARTAQLLLEAGRYTVEADLPGYETEKREVLLDGGETRTLEIEFTTKVGIGDHSGPTGKLSVRTVPWSTVYIGGEKLGQAPFASVELPAGTHTLTFKNPSRPVVTKTVVIKAGKLTKLNFSLP